MIFRRKASVIIDWGATNILNKSHYFFEHSCKTPVITSCDDFFTQQRQEKKTMLNLRKKMGWAVSVLPEEREAWYSEFGQIMRQARYSMDISLAELAVALNITEETLSEYECGNPVPFIEANAIFQYLGMHQQARKRFKQ